MCSVFKQGHTIGYPVTSRNVDAHVAHFRELVQEAKDMGAVMINVGISPAPSFSFPKFLGWASVNHSALSSINVHVVGSAGTLRL